MKNTGDLLKTNRKKKNLSIEEVSITTKISPRVLKAIESGDESALPAKSFVRGFVKTYAQVLQMDTKMVMQSFEEEMGLPTSKEPIEESKPEADEIEKNWIENIAFIQKASTTSKAIAVSAIVFLIILVMVVKSTVEKYENEKTDSPAIAVEPIKPEKSESPVKPAEPVKPQPMTAKEKPSVSSKPETQKPPMAKPMEKNVAEPAAKPDKTPVVEAKKPDPVKPNEEVMKEAPKKPESKPAAKAKLNLEVIIEALDFVAISYRLDNGDLKSIDLRPDQFYTLKATQKLAIDVSDAGAINVIYNGVDKGVAGNIGEEKKLRFP